MAVTTAPVSMSKCDCRQDWITTVYHLPDYSDNLSNTVDGCISILSDNIFVLKTCQITIIYMEISCITFFDKSFPQKKFSEKNFARKYSSLKIFHIEILRIKRLSDKNFSISSFLHWNVIGLLFFVYQNSRINIVHRGESLRIETLPDKKC